MSSYMLRQWQCSKVYVKNISFSLLRANTHPLLRCRCIAKHLYGAFYSLRVKYKLEMKK